MQSLRIATLFVTVLCVLGPAPARAQAKVAIVDMQRALTETEDGKTAKAQLEKLKDAKQKDIDAQQTELRKLKEQFDTQRAMLKDDVRQQREMELAEKLNALKMRYVQDQQTLAVDEAKATKPILERMSRILQTMGRDQKWTLILEKNESSVLYSEASLDLTNELIRRYNAGEGKK
ncbi:MAG: OmpH family outer membrane protein [Bradymonadia bacterium]|jgi:outer membrane protein